MHKISICIYSHTSYLKILKIQTDYIKKYNYKLILIINKNELDLEDIYSIYDEVIFYDDLLPYSYRLISCLSKIYDDYLVLIHDIDIVLNIDINIIDNFIMFMYTNCIDRIDLKYNYDANNKK